MIITVSFIILEPYVGQLLKVVLSIAV